MNEKEINERLNMLYDELDSLSDEIDHANISSLDVVNGMLKATKDTIARRFE